MKNKFFSLLLVLSFLGGGCAPGDAPQGQASATVSPANKPLEQVAQEHVLKDTSPDHNQQDTASTIDTMDATSSSSALTTYTGTFVKVQEGDYLHFVILDAAGTRHSFWVAENMPQDQYVPFLDGEYPAGQKVEVEAQQVTRFIPESGAEETFDEAVTIRLAD